MPRHLAAAFTSTDFEQLDEQARAFVAGDSAPGVAFGLLVDGALVHSGGFGSAHGGLLTPEAPNARSVFRIASMTKSFTAATVMSLREAGLLRLDDPVSHYLPEAKGLRGPTEDSPPVSVRHLLTMSSGLATDDPWGDRQQDLPVRALDEILAEGPRFAWAPGSAYEYSNLGYAVLGRVITAVTGQEFAEAVTERILTPLGMRASTFDPAAVPVERIVTGYARGTAGWTPVPAVGHGAFSPMGGLLTSVEDLTIWVSGFLDAFPPRNDDESAHPLSRAVRREMQQPHRGLGPEVVWPDLGERPMAVSCAYAMGLVHFVDTWIGTTVSHSGGYPGFGSHMRWHPESGVGIVVLANGTYSPASQLGVRMLRALLTPRRRLLCVQREQPAPHGESAWPETIAAQGLIDRLLQAWDDDRAAQVFADNIEPDQAIAERRTALTTEIDRVGGLVPVLDPEPTRTVEDLTRHLGATRHESPAHAAWSLPAREGEVRVEILLSPEPQPRVQMLRVSGIRSPASALASAAAAVVTAMAQNPVVWPHEAALAPHLQEVRLGQLLAAAATWIGPCTLGPATAGDGLTTTTYRLEGSHGAALLTLTIGSEDSSELVTAVAVGLSEE